MRSIPIDIFLSESFDIADKEVNDFFASICKGLDLRIENVSFGASRVPPDQARKLIARAQGLIAICPRREELVDGSFNMPQAVNDEIAFACGIDTPILAIMEGGVNKGGFKEKFRTYLQFDRGKLNDPSFIQDAIRSIHEFKVDLIDHDQISSAYEPADSHAETLTHLVELKKHGDDFVWEYSTTKKIVYTKDSNRSFPTSVFSTQGVKIPDNSDPIHWDYEHISSSRGLRLIPTIDQQTAACVDVRLKPEPAAEENDHITYRTYSRSRYLIPLWEDEAADDRKVHLEKGDFRVSEGLLFIHRTKKAIIEFRLCREYGIEKKDIVPFVGSYTSSIDFEVESELERANVRVEDFGGSLTIRMEIDSALPGHLYGIAWNPPPRPVKAP